MATLRCKDAFATEVKGVPRVVAAGELVDSADPIVKGRERFFESADAYVARRSAPASVEQATAAPGEARTVSTTKRATTRKTSDK